ncbi:hypothetical protein PoB_004028600 [Plakobranchus ocellatus]|uniref:Uncharacterized protein n=1 Tax=Plakobranchus ocellatus TaxID=259542 RepID=A0AAV4ARM0_9GAST|nr:hypothetical protein PoB_004028600 [Plakobranchus ocellatus]
MLVFEVMVFNKLLSRDCAVDAQGLTVVYRGKIKQCNDVSPSFLHRQRSVGRLVVMRRSVRNSETVFRFLATVLDSSTSL